MKDCTHSKIKMVSVGNGMCQDECESCGCLMVPDWNATKNGITPFKAKPMAKVISLADFRKRKEEGQKNG